MSLVLSPPQKSGEATSRVTTSALTAADTGESRSFNELHYSRMLFPNLSPYLESIRCHSRS